MPRGRGKGGNKRKKGKNQVIGERRELLYKEEGQEYGQILRLLGSGRVEVNCFDNVKRLCTIRGKLRHRVWMNAGDLILVSLRDFGDDKADIIHKYYPEEAFELQELGEIPENITINEGMVDEDEGIDGDDLLIGGSGSDSDDGAEPEKKLDDNDIDDI